MRRGDFYNTKPRFYRRRNRVTTLWGNGVWSLTGLCNLFIGTMTWAMIGFAGYVCLAVAYDDILERGTLHPGTILGLCLMLPASLVAMRYLARVWLLWAKAWVVLTGRRVMMFNSRRLWVRGLTPRFGLPWEQVRIQFARKRYYWGFGPGSLYGFGLKTKIFVAGRVRKLREWDVWLLTGRDLQTLLLYDLWRYRDRTGDKRWQLGRKAYSDDRSETPYPEGID